LTNLGVTKGANNLLSYAYTLDAAGHRTNVTEQSGRTVSYSYDNLYRLTNETVAADPSGINGAVNYTYDPVGNRKQLTSTLAPVPAGLWNYDANDRFTAGDTYDANGNTVSSGGIGNVYDFENHLVQKGGVTIVYDGDGNRVAKTVAGVMTRYLVDTKNPTGYAQVIAEEFASTANSAVYVYGLERISKAYYSDQFAGPRGFRYYVYDGHGSVRALADTSGNVTDTYDYDAFGILIHSTFTSVPPLGTTVSPSPNNYLYSGEQFDADLNLYYNRARYLNVSTGRFWSMDSFDGYVSDPLSLHKYLYCFGNAPDCVDPSGQEGDSASTLAATAYGIIIDSIRILNFLKAVAVVGALAVGYVAAPYIDDAFERNKSRFAELGVTVSTAVALFQYHFQRWRQDPDFQRGGNHYVAVGLPSGPTSTPRVTVDTITVQIPLTSHRVILEFYEGGKGGRIFSVQYRIGANATLGRGYFGFRADYLDFRSNPPVFSPHVHWTYSLGGEDQDEDHVPF